MTVTKRRFVTLITSRVKLRRAGRDSLDLTVDYEGDDARKLTFCEHKQASSLFAHSPTALTSYDLVYEKGQLRERTL